MHNDNRSTVVEQNLADYGITAQVLHLPLDQIDATASVSLQNRAGVKLDDDHVAQMVVHLKGDPDKVLPRIVVARFKGKIVVVDGNHRCAAYREAGRTSIDAYLIEDATAEQVEELVLEANASNALGLGAAERLHLALKYAERCGDVRLAAQRYGYTYDTLATKRRAAEGVAKARRAAGVKASLPDAKAEVINRLDEDQIRQIGRDLIEKASTPELKKAAANILAVPASQQSLQVATEVGRLAQAVKDKSKPLGKARAKDAGPTLKVATAQVRKIAGLVRTNPAWRADADLVAAIEALAKEVRGGVADEHAA